jgi:hypothetical protein
MPDRFKYLTDKPHTQVEAEKEAKAKIEAAKKAKAEALEKQKAKHKLASAQQNLEKIIEQRERLTLRSDAQPRPSYGGCGSLGGCGL